MRIIFQIVIFILLGTTVSYCQLLGTACEPYGSISIRGEPAADNMPVVAYIDNHEMASCLTIGGQYSLVIAKDNPDTPEKDGWAEGDIIMIMVNSTIANPSFAASAGRMRIDLTLNSLGVRLDTWGKIKALFK